MAVSSRLWAHRSTDMMMQGGSCRPAGATATPPPTLPSRPPSDAAPSSLSAAEHMGQSRLELPATSGQSFFHLTTHLSKRSPSLRHCLSGFVVNKLDRYRSVELLLVNKTRIKGWPHTRVSFLLQQHLGNVTAVAELKLTVRATDEMGRQHQIELTFDLIYEDGSIGDRARAVYEVIVRLKDKVISTPDVTDVQYERCRAVHIRHGALTGQFMRVGPDRTLCMDVPGNQDDYVFDCYDFVGHDETGCGDGGGGGRGGGGGGGGRRGGDDCDGKWPTLCVLRKPHTREYVEANAVTCRLTVNDGELNTDIHVIKTPDSRFFIVHPSGNGNDDEFCLRPLILRDYYLRYDAVDGLRLKRCRIPPYQDPAIVRYFTFTFVQAQQAH